VNASAAWELDFWGKFRRATEAARANLVASESARQEVMLTLVANVSGAYFHFGRWTWSWKFPSGRWLHAGSR